MFKTTFDGLERAFVNKIIVSLKYKSFLHNTKIFNGKFQVQEAYFVIKGNVAVCESSCYNEPIMVNRPGHFILLY